MKITSVKSNRSYKEVDFLEIVIREWYIKMLVSNTHHFDYLLTK